jgi:hypothetical protein
MLSFCCNDKFLILVLPFCIVWLRVEHCVLLWCSRVYLSCIYTSCVLYLWVCINVYYDVEHFVLIVTFLIGFLLLKISFWLLLSLLDFCSLWCQTFRFDYDFPYWIFALENFVLIVTFLIGFLLYEHFILIVTFFIGFLLCFILIVTFLIGNLSLQQKYNVYAHNIFVTFFSTGSKPPPNIYSSSFMRR